MITTLIFTPIVFAILVLCVPGKNPRALSAFRTLTLVGTGIPLVLATLLLFRYTGGYQWVEKVAWIPQFHIQYYVGLDGLSLPMVWLTVLLSFLGSLASWSIQKDAKGYFALYLFLEAGMLGVFSALDFFLFFVFWEVMLLPMYFLIGIWGGTHRTYAAIKFFLYTLFGSVLLLLVMIGMYWYATPATFSFVELSSARPFFGKVIEIFGHTYALDRLLWLALFVAFAVKVPVFPFHTWLPWAHVEAPTAVSVLLAGVLLKMGTYGLLRLNFSILPEATVWASYGLAVFGVINIIYGAFCALAQKDLKKLVAYSSISHMGFVLLGLASLTSAGLSGAVLLMFHHGLSSGLLFLVVGVLYDRAHHRWIIRPDGTRGFGGIASVAPVYTLAATIAVFAALGLPGFSGFISEVLVFLGAFQVPALRGLVLVASLGIILGAAYLLWMFMRVFLGPRLENGPPMPDLVWREKLTLFPLCGLLLAVGVYPQPVLTLMNQTLQTILKIVVPGL